MAFTLNRRYIQVLEFNQSILVREGRGTKEAKEQRRRELICGFGASKIEIKMTSLFSKLMSYVGIFFDLMYRCIVL